LFTNFVIKIIDSNVPCWYNINEIQIVQIKKNDFLFNELYKRKEKKTDLLEMQMA